MNCDGIDDLIVNKPEAYSSKGAIEIFWGSQTSISSIADLELSGSASGDNFGSSIANAGDVNGDGFDDLIVGSSGAVDSLGWPTGITSVYFGGNHTHSNPNWTVDGEDSGDKFGGRVSSAGDVNNDGFDDILITSTWFTQSGGEGKVYLFLGSSTGPESTKIWSTRGYWQDVVQGLSLIHI